MAYRVNFSARLLDGDNVSSTALAYVSQSGAETLSELITALNTWLADLDTITDAVITETRLLIVPGTPGGLKTQTTATTTWDASSVQKTGQFLFSNVNSVGNWGFSVPAIAQSLISGGKIDNSNANVAAILNLMATSPYCTNEGVLLNGFIQSIQGARTKRKQLQARSRNSTPA